MQINLKVNQIKFSRFSKKHPGLTQMASTWPNFFSVTFSLKLILDYLLSLKLLAEGNSLKILSIIIFPSNVTNDFNFYCIRCWKNDDKTLNRYKDCDFNANIAKRKRKRNSLSFDDGKSILRKQILPLSQFFTSHWRVQALRWRDNWSSIDTENSNWRLSQITSTVIRIPTPFRSLTPDGRENEWKKSFLYVNNFFST